jgi:type VI secretion system Hcp family effector
MAFEAYMKWVGTRTTFKPEVTPGASTFRKGHEAECPIVRSEYEVSVPYDATHGSPKHKRVHQPFTVTKEFGASTPCNLMVACGNELLSSVVINYYKVGNDGNDLLMYTTTLTNAHIVKIRQYTGHPDADSSATSKSAEEHDTMELEEISFTFEKIQQEDQIAKTIVIDDWLATGPTS